MLAKDVNDNAHSQETCGAFESIAMQVRSYRFTAPSVITRTRGAHWHSTAVLTFATPKA